MKLKIKKIILSVIIFLSVSGFFAVPKFAHAQLGPLVGGRFLPGLFDIFTPTPSCGLLVSVVGPNPGVFVWAPTIYNYFNMTAFHVGTHVLGNSIVTPCGPILTLYGSSLIP